MQVFPSYAFVCEAVVFDLIDQLSEFAVWQHVFGDLS